MNENNEIEHQLEEVGGELAAVTVGAVGLAHESKIKVNGRTRPVKGNVVSFEEVVKLAFPSGPTKPNIKFTVTYRNAAQVPAMDELDPGQSVTVKPGRHPEDETIFNVTETVLS